ncbi:Lrp/AsnC family transcriptional regulator [Haloarchaeobius iranensis]|uniref:DNA-binding transcriptional regulator, Lrp family n=1 Tax=Haloarchaeobius iranensis TaxID=996166 RepID=A0A1G9T1D8_9EURY|nr:Lrp/AsnC family transcriptional regulator [Haloarchaeobius iranensis]SDM41553.1 DNA-binding transcriptional regulator, Lrp family [Haloarchaeobius iranensis]
MDERDIRLLKAIAELGTGSPDKLHEETGIPVSTIHYRLNNLREDGIVENDLYDLDLDAFGLSVTVIVEVLADYSGTHSDVADGIREIEGVTQLFSTMGETDFIAIARVGDADMVGDLMRSFEEVPEIERTNSTYVIDTLWDDARGLESYSMETLLSEFTDD